MSGEHQKKVFDFMNAIPSHKEKLIPSQPHLPDVETRKLCARLLLEEVLETVEALGVAPWFYGVYGNILGSGDLENERLGLQSKDHTLDMVGIADGLADVEYVTLFTANACGISLEPIFDTIANNNMLKVEKGRIGEDGKLIKPSNHPSPEPEIAEILKEQGWVDT